MNNKLKLALCAGLATLVAGCGGSGTTETYDSLSVEAAAKLDQYLTADGDLLPGQTARADVQNVGSATYNGYIDGTIDPGGADEAGLVGDLTLGVNFATTAVTGTARNFQHETLGAMGGQLVANPPLGIVDFDAGPGGEDLLSGVLLEGELTQGQTNYSMDINLDGEFVGGSGATLPLAVGGYADGSFGDPALVFEGRFIAER